MTLKKIIQEQLNQYHHPKRKAFSSRWPFLKHPIIKLHQWTKKIKNLSTRRLDVTSQKSYYPQIIARHQSLLMRQLGDSDQRLQKQKIINLRVAAKKLDKIVIAPGQIFSFWEVVSEPTEKKGYTTGMLLSGGKVVEGQGGGLCQLSNLLFWLFLHAPLEIKERHHHSLDVFPDSGRVLPFGSGATIMYNYVDLQVKNISDVPIQLHIWLTEKHLKGRLLSPTKKSDKYHLYEKNHCFVRHGHQYFRYNEIWRQIKQHGIIQKNEKLFTNFAPVMYNLSETKLKKEGHTMVKL